MFLTFCCRYDCCKWWLKWKPTNNINVIIKCTTNYYWLIIVINTTTQWHYNSNGSYSIFIRFNGHIVIVMLNKWHQDWWQHQRRHNHQHHRRRHRSSHLRPLGSHQPGKMNVSIETLARMVQLVHRLIGILQRDATLLQCLFIAGYSHCN